MPCTPAETGYLPTLFFQQQVHPLTISHQNEAIPIFPYLIYQRIGSTNALRDLTLL